MDKNVLSGLYGRLTEPLPREALSVDDSRGFNLTSIKAAFILERLNGVFGLAGYGWRYVHSPVILDGQEATCWLALQWRLPDGEAGCPPVEWSAEAQGFICRPAFTTGLVWSEAIVANGGSGTVKRKGAVPMTDAIKGAVTNAICKAASRLGVGQDVFKGEEEPRPEVVRAAAERRKARPGKGGQVGAAGQAGNGAGYGSLSKMQAAARAEYDRLDKVQEDKVNLDKICASLHAEMERQGIDIEPVLLVKGLLGMELGARSVFAVSSWLHYKRHNAADVTLLNKMGTS